MLHPTSGSRFGLVDENSVALICFILNKILDACQATF